MLASKITETMNTLGWDHDDNIVVEIGGTQVSGIDVGDDYNKKWSSPIGTRKYNKDAFIVIKNLDRNPFVSSQPMEEFNPRHPYESKKEEEQVS
jgi:hypothetical protein|tara:strand:+ start:94 stop:375 length:282 start_codon:yes stop_codon:yes gene_type:complete